MIPKIERFWEERSSIAGNYDSLLDKNWKESLIVINGLSLFPSTTANDHHHSASLYVPGALQWTFGPSFFLIFVEKSSRIEVELNGSIQRLTKMETFQPATVDKNHDISEKTSIQVLLRILLCDFSFYNRFRGALHRSNKSKARTCWYRACKSQTLT